MRDYEYEVFFSYKRHPRNQFWISQVSGLVKFWLREEGVGSAEVFVDVESIEAGDPWPIKLRQALGRSKCMVAVWSAPYFQSKWCLSEWQTIREREKLIGSKLIVPVVFHDGEHFPEDARMIQSYDFKDYAFTEQSFWKTTRAYELEGEIKKVCAIASKIVRDCPPCDETWPTMPINEVAAISGVPLMKL